MYEKRVFFKGEIECFSSLYGLDRFNILSEKIIEKLFRSFILYIYAFLSTLLKGYGFMAFYDKKERRIPHRRLATLLILTGILIAISSYFQSSLVYKFWPVFPLMLSTGFLGIFFKRKKKEAAFLSIGVYLLCFSFLAFYLNFTSWGQLAFLWPLFILFLSLVFFSVYGFCEKRGLYLFTALILLSTALLFFILFHISTSLWWLVLIFLGLSILIAERKK